MSPQRSYAKKRRRRRVIAACLYPFDRGDRVIPDRPSPLRKFPDSPPAPLLPQLPRSASFALFGAASQSPCTGMAIGGTVNRRSRTEIPISATPQSASLPGKCDCRERQAAIPAGWADLRCRKSQILRGNADFGAAANAKPARKGRLTLPQVANPARPAALPAPKKRKWRKKPGLQRFLSLFRNPFSAFRHPCQAQRERALGAQGVLRASSSAARCMRGRSISLARSRLPSGRVTRPEESRARRALRRLSAWAVKSGVISP